MEISDLKKKRIQNETTIFFKEYGSLPAYEERQDQEIANRTPYVTKIMWMVENSEEAHTYESTRYDD